MIDFLKGILVQKSPTRLVIEVNGVGYEVNITLHCYENIGETGKEIQVITYLHVREDILQLYGFSSGKERGLFLNLISAPGIGPKKAQVILSSVAAEKLQRYILEEDLTALTSLSGVGKKTAQRLILDLKDKIASIAEDDQLPPATDEAFSTIKHLMREAEAALMSLGFSKNVAHAAVQKVIRKNNDINNVEELIKQALKNV